MNVASSFCSLKLNGSPFDLGVEWRRAEWPEKGFVVPRRRALIAGAVRARRAADQGGHRDVALQGGAECRGGEVSLTRTSATATPSGTHF